MSNTRERFHVGDRVKFDFGQGKVIGVIMEDRGPLGGGGRHLFRAEVPQDPFEPMSVELSEDTIEAVDPAEVSPPLEKDKIIEYLKSGGLIAILRANRAGGPSEPRAWLCPNSLGNVTHTFNPDRSGIGGQLVPARATQDFKVTAAKKAAVASFLESFGLSHDDAEEVIAEVGIAATRRARIRRA